MRFPKALLGPERISVHGGTLEDLRQSVALLTNMAKLNLLLSELRVQLVVLCAEARVWPPTPQAAAVCRRRQTLETQRAGLR